MNNNPSGGWGRRQTISAILILLALITGYLIYKSGIFSKSTRPSDERCSWQISRENLERLGLECSMIVGYYYGPAIVGMPSEEDNCNPVAGCYYDPEIIPFETIAECQAACQTDWSVYWGEIFLLKYIKG